MATTEPSAILQAGRRFLGIAMDDKQFEIAKLQLLCEINAALAGGGGGGGTPGGADTQLQYNNSGAFGGQSRYSISKTSPIFRVGDPANAADQPVLQLRSGLNTGIIGYLDFFGEDSASNSDSMALIEALIDDNTSGSEDAHLRFRARSAGSVVTTLDNRADQTIFGDGATALQRLVLNNGNTLTLQSTPTASRTQTFQDATGTIALLSDIPGATGTESGENWIRIFADDPDPTVNAQAVRDAYAAAKLTTPFGNALAANNRYVILLMPGQYDFGASPLAMDTAFIDLRGAHAPFGQIQFGSVARLSANATILIADTTVLTVSADNIALENLALDSDAPTSGNPVISIGIGVSTSAHTWMRLYFFTGSPHQPTGITFAGNYLEVVSEEGGLFATDEDCSGQFTRCGGAENCFADTGDCSGRFIECFADGNSFGGATGSIASGDFLRCYRFETNTTSGIFGDGGTASGDFVDCHCMNGSSGFASEGGVASGNFINCSAGPGSFGGTRTTGSGGVSGMEFTGVAIRCSAGTTSFGGGNTSRAGDFTGTCYHCYAGAQSFGSGGAAVTLTGSCYHCRCDNDGFGSNLGIGPATNSMVLAHCSGGVDCVATSGIAAGFYFQCNFSSGSFASGSSSNFSGEAYHCRASTDSFGGGGGTFSGSAWHCVGGDGSFGGASAANGGTMSGNARHCHGGAESFGGGSSAAGTMSGRMHNCTLVGRLRATVSGEIFGMVIRPTVTNQAGIAAVVAGYHIHHCTVIGTGTSPSINNPGASQAGNIHHCSFNVALGGNISNNVVTPLNVVDAAIA